MQIRSSPNLIGVCSIAIVSVIAFWAFGIGEKIIQHEKNSENDHTTISNSAVSVIEKTPMISPASADPEPQHMSPIISKKKQDTIQNDKSDLSDKSTKNQFRLSLSGTYYAGSPNLSKPANLEIIFRSASSTNLDSFVILETKMVLGNLGIQLKNPSIVIKGTDIQIIFDSVGSFVIKGTLDESILKDNKQTVVITNQLFYLAQKDLPYHLDMTGTLSSS